jgi:hypothetical protein
MAPNHTVEDLALPRQYRRHLAAKRGLPTFASHGGIDPRQRRTAWKSGVLSRRFASVFEIPGHRGREARRDRLERGFELNEFPALGGVPGGRDGVVAVRLVIACVAGGELGDSGCARRPGHAPLLTFSTGTFTQLGEPNSAFLAILTRFVQI